MSRPSNRSGRTDKGQGIYAAPSVFTGSANRVGAVYVPWRVLDGGVTLEQALAEAHEIGLKSPELAAKAREYVMRAR